MMPKITMDEFQKACERTANYHGKGEYLGLTYVTLGLASEAGEVAGKAKKINRDNGCRVDGPARLAVAGEVFDVMWYCMQTLTELGFSASEVAEAGLDKLASRAERGVIGGEGDHR